eukprot:m.107028 g.107028  ORF g.107028 m.107028 type:complete len:95 (-) comp13908_c1_seq1:3666-3950(-)
MKHPVLVVALLLFLAYFAPSAIATDAAIVSFEDEFRCIEGKCVYSLKGGVTAKECEAMCMKTQNYVCDLYQSKCRPVPEGGVAKHICEAGCGPG